VKQTPVRTLLLLVGLFAAVVVYQSAALTPTARASIVWLEDDPNEVADPNESTEPMPESVGAFVWLEDDPNEVADPNESAEPMPESVGAFVWLEDDPNEVEDPNEPTTDPQPEAV